MPAAAGRRLFRTCSEVCAQFSVTHVHLQPRPPQQSWTLQMGAMGFLTVTFASCSLLRIATDWRHSPPRCNSCVHFFVETVLQQRPARNQLEPRLKSRQCLHRSHQPRCCQRPRARLHLELLSAAPRRHHLLSQRMRLPLRRRVLRRFPLQCIHHHPRHQAHRQRVTGNLTAWTTATLARKACFGPSLGIEK